jgi:hypothetical protein
VLKKSRRGVPAGCARGTAVALVGARGVLRGDDACSLVLAAFALTACGPIEEEEGALGNGDFFYNCVSWQDPSCAAATSLEPSESLPFPSKIAFGASFGLGYGQGGWWGPSFYVQPASSDWLPYDAPAGYYTAERVGQPWVVASVVSIVGGSAESPSDTVTVEYVAGGTAALYAWTSTAQGATTLTVPGGSSTDDAGAEAGAP